MLDLVDEQERTVRCSRYGLDRLDARWGYPTDAGVTLELARQLEQKGSRQAGAPYEPAAPGIERDGQFGLGPSEVTSRRLFGDCHPARRSDRLAHASQLGRTKPASYAMTTSCARSRAPTLVMARLTWVRTVAWLTKSCRAISSLARPLATRAVTSRSRSVRAVSSVCGAEGAVQPSGVDQPSIQSKPHLGPVAAP